MSQISILAGLVLILVVGCGTDRPNSGAPMSTESTDGPGTDVGPDSGTGSDPIEGGGAPTDVVPPSQDAGAEGPLRFNELMSQNDGAWIDDLGEADDWIELVNTGDTEIDLSDYRIADDSGRSAILPDLELAPGARVVLFADDSPQQGALHLPFKLAAEGDYLVVWHADGTVNDELELPSLGVNEAWARVPDAVGEWVRCRYATPTASNGETCAPPKPPSIEDDVRFAPFALPNPFPAFRDGLSIAELALRPAEGDPAFVELYNAGDRVIALDEAVLNVSAHKPHQPWPDVNQGAAVPLPGGSLGPGERAFVELPASALAALQADPEFEGVVTLFSLDGLDVFDRVDFMHWPVGAALARVPDAAATLRYCRAATPLATNECDVLPSRDVGDRLRALRTPGDFAALARGAERLGIGTVKFVVDLQALGLVHLLGSARWPLHYTFVRERVYRQPELDRCDPAQDSEFYQGWVEFSNAEYYATEGRRFLLGTLSHHSGADVHAIEYTFGDRISAAQMRTGYYEVVPHTWDPGGWVIRPQDPNQVAKARQIEGSVPLVSPNAPFVDVTFQPLTEGVAYGTLRFIPAGELDGAQLGPDVIVVTDDVPNDIALVGGLVTEAFQTPLAHVNVLSQNRGTPNASLVEARRELAPYFDELVRLEVSAAGLDVRLADAEEAAEFWEQFVNDSPRVSPRIDTSLRGVQPLLGHSLASLPAIGAKASQLAELGHISTSIGQCARSVPLRLPSSPFAIPVVHSIEHLEASGARELLEELRLDPEFVADPRVRAEGLAAVRELIRTVPVEATLLTEVVAAVRDRFGSARVRFRSSSNTEDLPNFNGAGLYTSISAELGDDDRRVDDAIRTVWASLWNLRAYDERAYARIDDTNVAMGILVHPASLSEEANGVAVSRNVLEPVRGDIYYLNAQAGEASVTNPAPGVSTEQLEYQWNYTPAILYNGASSLLRALREPPPTVLTESEVADVACALRSIHDWFRPLLDPDQENPWFAMEIEFKLADSDRALVVKQARPHSFGRREAVGDCREF